MLIFALEFDMTGDSKVEAKRRAAEVAAGFVQAGQIVGLGTGSTAKLAVEALGAKLKDGLRITGVATSEATATLAMALGIPLIELNETDSIDLTIDGADEIDPQFNMIKGGGGALTREKLVAISSARRVIVVDDSKLVSSLGSTWPLPVEALPFCWRFTWTRLEALGCVARLRQRQGQPLVTDNGNYIIDCKFAAILDPSQLERAIKLLPGVVESGLFVGLADTLVIGFEDRVEVKEREGPTRP